MASKETEFIWKNQSERIRNAFKTMRLNGDFIDVTLWCEKRSIGAHKCILAAASDYFREIFKEVPNDRPAIVFKNVLYDDLFAVISYIYNGQVVVKNGSLGSFGKVAKMLEIDLSDPVTPLTVPSAPSPSSAARAMAPEVNVRDCDSGVNSAENSTSPPASQIDSVYGDRQSQTMTESTCSPSQSSTTSKAERGASTFDKQVNAIMRDMRIDTIDAAVTKLLKHDIYTTERATTVINVSIERATQFYHFATVYVKFCKRVIEMKPESTNNFSFKKLLLNRCHTIFTELIINNETKNSATYRRKCLGITRFIGCMYMHQLLFANIIEWIIGILIDFATEDKLEYLYELLAIVGKRIELKSDDYDTDIQWYRDLDEYYVTLSAIAKDVDHEMSSDTRRLLDDLVQSRMTGWRGPLKLLLGDYGPVVNQKMQQQAAHESGNGPVNVNDLKVPQSTNRPVNSNANLASAQMSQTDEIAEPANLDTTGTVQTIIESLRTFIREKNSEESRAATMAINKPSRNQRRKNRKLAAAAALNNINSEDNNETAA